MYLLYPPNISSPPSPVSTTDNPDFLAIEQTIVVGIWDESANGSEYTLGISFIKLNIWSSEILISVWLVPKCLAIFFAKWPSLKFFELSSGKEIVKLFILWLLFFWSKAVIKVESIPPDKNVPIGTFEIDWLFHQSIHNLLVGNLQ